MLEKFPLYRGQAQLIFTPTPKSARNQSSVCFLLPVILKDALCPFMSKIFHITQENKIYCFVLSCFLFELIVPTTI